ncbi:SpoIID/LytB domain-containing protein [bacterium]|nr:SpoIID/LytB domain-containing protein [bacterium]
MRNRVYIILLTIFFSLNLFAKTTIEQLYEKKLKFTQSGEPLILIGVGEAQSEIQLTLLEELFIQSKSKKVVKLEKNSDITIKYLVKTKGERKLWLIIDSYPYYSDIELSKYEEYVKNFKKDNKNLILKDIIVGNLSVIEGNVIDIRKKLLLFGPFEDDKTIQSIKQTLYVKNKIKTEIYAEVKSYPSGKISLYSEDKHIATFNNIFEIDGKSVKLNKIDYGFGKPAIHNPIFDGKLYFSINFNEGVSITNEIPIETLLRGVVPAEIFASAPMDALKAQTVAARTDILSKIGTRHFSDPYYICGTVHCQVYKGVPIYHKRSDKAIEDSFGEIMMDNDGIIDAYYSANSGGHTENNENVWLSRSRISLRGRDDFIDWANSGKFMIGITEGNVKDFIDNPPETYASVPSFAKKGSFRWRKSYTLEEIQKFIDSYIKINHIESKCVWKDFKPQGRGVSGRVMALKTICKNNKDSFTVYGELEIRAFLGYLKSALFYIEKSDDKIDFVGGGWGHGVGMCQHGSIGMAEKGKTYIDILKHYYTGVDIIKLYKKDKIKK